MTLRQKMTRYSIGTACLGLLGAVALTWGYGQSSFGGSSPAPTLPLEPPLRVHVRPARAVQQIAQDREYVGTVRSRRESQLRFERGGRVTHLHVEEGDQVQPGQLLAELDVELTRAEHEGVLAQTEAARARLEELVAGPRRETIAAAVAKVVAADAQVQRLERDKQRFEELLAAEAVSRERFDTTTFLLATQIAERDALQKQLDELHAGTRSEQLAEQRAVVKQLEAQVRRLQLDMEDGELRAPYAGTIVERLMDEGTVVSAGSSVVRLAETGHLEAWMGLPPQVARQVEVGTQQTLLVGTDRIPALVRSVRPDLDGRTRTQNVILTMEPEDRHGIVPGRIVRWTITEQVPAEGYVLPSTSLVPGPRGLWNVLVLPATGPHVVERRQVEVLYTRGDDSLVQGTLQPGDRVIMDGTHRVVAGQTVEPLAEETAQ